MDIWTCLNRCLNVVIVGVVASVGHCLAHADESQSLPKSTGVLAIRIWVHEESGESQACFYRNVAGDKNENTFELLYPKAISQSRYTQWRMWARGDQLEQWSEEAPQNPVNRKEINQLGLALAGLPIGLTAINLALVPAGSQWQMVGFGFSALVTLASAGLLAWDISRARPSAPKPPNPTSLETPLATILTPKGVVTFYRVPEVAFGTLGNWLDVTGEGSRVDCD